MTKWSQFGFVNIQSFVKEIITLNTNGLTVFEARSETAKSIAFKCIKLGVNYDKYDLDVRNSIVRNWWDWKSKADDGIFVLTTTDNYTVKFVFSINAMWTYAYKGKELIYSGKGKAPEEICKLINIKPNKTLKRIINIIDNDSPLLFDTSGEEYDSSIIEVFLRHDELENRKTNAIELLKKIKTARKAKSLELIRTEEQLKFVKRHKNLALSKIYLGKLTEVCSRCEYLELIQTELSSINSYRRPVYTDITDLEKIYNNLKSISDLIYLVEDLLNTPSNLKIFDNELNILSEKFNYTSKLGIILTELRQVYFINKPEIISDKLLYDMENKLNTCNKLSYILRELLDLYKLEKPKNDLNFQENFLDKSLKNLKEVSILLENIEDYLSLFDSLDNLKIEEQKIKKECDKFLKENPLCPTCGSSMKEVLVS